MVYAKITLLLCGSVVNICYNLQRDFLVQNLHTAQAAFV